MTSPDCANGTERCAEALEVLGGDYDLVVNLQGDAPLTPPWFVEELIVGLRAAPDAGIATPVLRCDGATLAALLADRKAGVSAIRRQLRQCRSPSCAPIQARSVSSVR